MAEVRRRQMSESQERVVGRVDSETKSHSGLQTSLRLFNEAKMKQHYRKQKTDYK